MASKKVLNRQIQILETSLIKLRKAHNEIIDEINNKVQCEECRKVKIAHAKKRKRDFDIMSASLLGVFTNIDYSAEPYKLFPKEHK